MRTAHRVAATAAGGWQGVAASMQRGRRMVQSCQPAPARPAAILSCPGIHGVGRYGTTVTATGLVAVSNLSTSAPAKVKPAPTRLLSPPGTRIAADA